MLHLTQLLYPDEL